MIALFTFFTISCIQSTFFTLLHCFISIVLLDAFHGRTFTIAVVTQFHSYFQYFICHFTVTSLLSSFSFSNLSCGELSAGPDCREEEESFYTKRKSQLNVIFSVLGTPEEVSESIWIMQWSAAFKWYCDSALFFLNVNINYTKNRFWMSVPPMISPCLRTLSVKQLRKHLLLQESFVSLHMRETCGQFLIFS